MFSEKSTRFLQQTDSKRYGNGTTEVHLLIPPTLFRVTTNFRNTRILTHVLKKYEEKNP